jgi:hypothetical protein
MALACAPNAMAQIFCEDQIQQGQRDVLTLVYGGNTTTTWRPSTMPHCCVRGAKRF